MSDVVRDAIAEMLAGQQRVLTPTAASGYGVDLVCFDDFEPSLRETDPNSVESLAQDNYHRLITEPGSLPDDLDFGKDITSWLSRGMTPLDVQDMQGEAETELLKDDRNQEVSASVVVSDSLPTTLALTLSITPADPELQTFTMIVAVDAAGVSLKAIQ